MEANLSRAQSTQCPTQPLNKTSVLYIDDDPINRSLVNRLLSSYDLHVLEAGTGLEGISIAKELQPKLILMDINMPGLDGHETTTRMRSIPALQKIPIVAVTARTTKGERELALAAGCDGYIPKPIDVDNFPHQVISYLDGYKDTITQTERQQYLGEYSQKLVERLEAKIIELEGVNRKLQKIDKIKSDFITLAAHELRTPITLIYGYARLLQLTATESCNLNPEEGSIGDLAGRIFVSVHRLNETINDILNISLLEANEMYLDWEPVNLGQVINAALRELNRTQMNRELTIDLNPDLSSLPSIIGDPQRLQQVFWNLLSNSPRMAAQFRSKAGWSTHRQLVRVRWASPQPTLPTKGLRAALWWPLSIAALGLIRMTRPKYSTAFTLLAVPIIIPAVRLPSVGVAWGWVCQLLVVLCRLITAASG